MKIMFYNADDNGNVAKTILAGCYKFGSATLLRQGGGATMTSVIEYDETESKAGNQERLCGD